VAYLVGGFFGKIFKAIKKVAHVAGKVVGTAMGVASAALPGPSGRLIAGIGGKLVGVKSAYHRVSAIQRAVNRYGVGMRNQVRVPGLLSKQSTVMPGGSHAKGSRLLVGKRKASHKRSRVKARARARPRRAGKRLKFGSAAYRKKYLGHR
jgi:hypothetical protein